MADSLTEGLKRAAPNWSLAGDKQLLDVLQGLHQKIIEKCQETNRNLEKMVTALDEASIHLQNVNNKFTALSNTQFIESRVFDDDGEDLTEQEKPKEQTEPKEETELDRINRGLQVLERMHESVTILCDSDSDSGTDDEDITRVVLKPKDLYADRPLPYIIGSKAWKAKWHAGLLPDESDTDSGSVKETANNEEYSDSEPEPISESPRRYVTTHTRRSPTISSSSDIESEEEIHCIPPPPPSQSAVAAELARRLGGTSKLPDIEPEPLPPSPAVRKIYKPHQPAPGNVFLDEPPPIDTDQSEDEDDIFAEINKKQPYRQSHKADSSVADDLFGRPVFEEVPPPNPANQKQLLFEEESEPELFASEKPAPVKKEHDVGVKKPVGAMSMFGSNANAESIGAAILKRNRRHSSTSGEETDKEPTQTKNTKKSPIEATHNTNVEKEREPKTQKEKERDIFEDLFAKSERINKQNNNNNIKDRKDEEQSKKPEKKPNLFSDNIFDDIDDIFTTSVKIVSQDDKKKQKSIFDDDDLFAEVSEPVKLKKDANKDDTKSKKDIFVDEDDIFSDKIPEMKKQSDDNFKNKNVKVTKSLFDDSDDELFSDKTNKNALMSVNMAKGEFVNNIASESVKTEIVERGLFSDDDDIFKNDNSKGDERKFIDDSSKISPKENEIHTEKSKQPSDVKNVEKGLFSDDEDLFKTENNIPSIKEQKSTVDSSKISIARKEIESETSKQPTKAVMSPDIFDEEDDGLFLFQSNQSVATAKQDSETISQNHDEPVNNKLLKNIEPESTNTDINLKKEYVLPKTMKSVFSDEDTPDDIISKPLRSENVNGDNFEDCKRAIFVKSEEEQVINRQEDETKVFNKLDHTIIETKISTVKPKLSDKPVTADVTVINTKITVVPNYGTDTLASQDTVPADTTVIDSKITVIPEACSVTIPNVTISEIQVSTKPNISRKPILAKKPIHNEERDEKDKTIISDDVKKVTEKVPIKNEEKTVNLPATNTDPFDDIFNDQPPVFEKPKEPKKSKNVNALFDDDSDDESLFFKKNDVIPDERPEGFISSDDKLFGLFMDEPPAIDVDFVQKSSKSDRLPKTSEISSQKDTSLSQTDQYTTEINTAVLKNAENDSGMASKFIDDDIFGNNTFKNKDKFVPNSNTEDLFSNITGDVFNKPSIEDGNNLFKIQKTDDDKSTVNEEKPSEPKTNDNENIGITDNAKLEPKKVGKLKPMNLNINVNTLLPGASPKKVVKSSDSTDGQAPSRSNDELSTNDAEIKDTEIEPTLVKSVSFEGNPDSSVLDNKLSKERAKIQVKRRPSTRRARREAVKKSGIDFGEDSTDNSSSIDDQSKVNRETLNNEDISAKNETLDFDSDLISDKDIDMTNIDQDTFASANDNVTAKDLESHGADNKNSNVLQSQVKSIFDSDEEDEKLESKEETKSDKIIEQKHVHKPSIEATSDVKNVKSKVVYILNDEDIFDTKSDQKSEASESIPKHTEAKPDNILFNDPDDLFKGVAKNEGITTLGQVYESKPKQQKLDFLSDSDDDLFKSSKTVKEVKTVERKPDTTDTSQVEVKNVTLKSKTRRSPFGDEDDDLFQSKTQEKSKMPSLFGSDSDEELFSGVKKEKEVMQKKREVKKEEIRKQVKNVSLFEDDDDDLFGVKTKKNEESKRQAAGAKKKEEIMTKHPEPVFADPLSLLDSDEE